MIIKGKNIKNKTLIQIIIVIILIIIILSTFMQTYSGLDGSDEGINTKKKVEQTAFDTSNDYEKTLEERLANILHHIKGVGNVDVMVTLETGEEIVPAVNENIQDTITNEKDKESGQKGTDEKNSQKNIVTLQKQSGEDEALILKQIKPKVKGVVVVAEGAGSSQVQLNISQAVETALNLEADRVQVFEMKK